MPLTVATLVTGVYDIPAAEVEVVGVATNKVPTGPYRGAGRPEAALLIERMADLAAGTSAWTPWRFADGTSYLPTGSVYATPMGLTYDSGDYRGSLDRACELLGTTSGGSASGLLGTGRLLGLGFAVFIERAGPQLWESAAAAFFRTVGW